MEGQGKLQWPDGRKFKGNYKIDQRVGTGVYFTCKNQLFIGNWLNGKQDGIGIYYDENGEKFVGLWKTGKKV